MNADYLWDRRGWPDPETVRLERLLGALQYQPSLAPRFALPPPRWRMFASVAVATAAAIVALIGLSWRGQAPSSPGLAVRGLAGAPTIASRPLTEGQQLRVGGWLETDARSRATIDVASVGRVEVEPDTRLGLLSTSPGDYRLQLSRGTMQAVIWAPPGQFSVKTSSSTAVDLGCIYTMSVDEDGVGLVRVSAGWVGFEWRGRESFIPAGAVCVTRLGLGPGTPCYEDASAALRGAVATIDEGRGPRSAMISALDQVLVEARSRDVLTLWHLLSRVDVDQRDRVFERLAGFVAAPPGVTREGIRAGNREMLDAWWDALDLGTAAWWRIWRQQWREGPWRRQE